MGNTNQWKIRDHRLCTVVESSMETRFHAANHTIPPSPSCEGSPTPRQGQKPLAVHGEKPNQDVGNYNLNGRDVILHVRLSLGNQFIIPL